VEFVQEMRKKLTTNRFLICLLGILNAAFFIDAQEALAAGGGIPETVNYYHMILHAMHLPEYWVPTVGALFITLIVLMVGVRYRSAVNAAGDDVIPGSRFSLRFVMESMMDMLYGLGKDNCGKDFRKFLPLIFSLFIFILFSNLSGLVPGFEPPTVSMDTNVAMGIIVFIVYNYAGLKEHGGSYIKHFLGPVAMIAPLFFLIELISHGSRPFSLGLRLMGNIFGDHTLLGVFTGLCVFVPVPALLMFFGLLVAVVQSYVFTLLTGIYISMAISHDH
jgi:F-type H+-transporting ATPase subunit a